MISLLLWIFCNPFSFLVSVFISAWNWGSSTEIFKVDQSDGNSSQYSTSRARRLGAAKCDDRKCTSAGNDCCAPEKPGEDATCSDGFLPIPTGRGCGGAYKCCKGACADWCHTEYGISEDKCFDENCNLCRHCMKFLDSSTSTETDPYHNCDDSQCNSAWDDCCAPRWANEPASCKNGLVPVRSSSDECVNNQNYRCCEGDPGETWSDDNEWFQVNLIRFYLLAVWMMLTQLTATYLLFAKLPKQPQFSDATLLPPHLRIGSDCKFAFKLFECCAEPSICCYVCWCDPAAMAEMHATVGTATFWQVFLWCVLAAVAGNVVAAVAEIEAKANIDIENYARGLLLALVMTGRRQALRVRLGQGQESRKNAMGGDFFAWWCCFCCAGIQEYRHVQAALVHFSTVAVGPPIQVQSQIESQPTIVGAPVAGTVTVLGQPVTTFAANTYAGATAVAGTTKAEQTTGAVVGTPVDDNPNPYMEAN